MRFVTIINFKTYKQGQKVLQLAKYIERIDKNIIVGVQATDIKEISSKTHLQVYSQHVDYFDIGRHTGFILPEAVKANGAHGTFLNHSEHRLSFDVIKKTVNRCKKVGLKIAIFAPNLNDAIKIKRLHPDFLIVEPPELVSGKISVSSAKPDLIKKISSKLKTKFLVGAGIHSSKDVKLALELGSSGIAVSSAITTSNNPYLKLKDLLRLDN